MELKIYQRDIQKVQNHLIQNHLNQIEKETVLLENFLHKNK